MLMVGLGTRIGLLMTVIVLSACEGHIDAPKQDVRPPPDTKTPINLAPTAFAGPDATVEVGQSLTLAGRAEDDGRPTPPQLDVEWSADGAAMFEDRQRAETSVQFPIAGIQTLTLSVTDGVLTATDTMIVTVTATTTTNVAPIVDAGPDVSGVVDTAVLLRGQAIDDGLPTAVLTTTWQVDDGPGAVQFTAVDSATTSAVFDAAGVYTVTLVASDGERATSDSMVVTITDEPPMNLAPVVDAGGSISVTLPATASMMGVVTDDGLPLGATVTSVWSVVSGPGTVMFTDPAGLRTPASFTMMGAYVLRLTASDGAVSAFDEVNVEVLPEEVINRAPQVNAGASQSVVRPAAASLNGIATDDGLPNSTLVITWSTQSGPGTATFGAPNNPATAVTFSAAGVYVLRLTADDGALSASSDTTVTVSDAPPTNQPPSVSAGASQTVRLPSGITLNGTATDDGLPNGMLTTMWNIVSAPGTVTFSNPGQLGTTVDFSTDGTYELRLDASDGALTSSSNVMITVLPPLNQAPTVNAGPSQTITLPSSATLSGAASDDGLPTGSSLVTTWSRVSGPGAVTFSNANVLGPTASFTVAGGYVLRLTATDGVLSASSNVSVTVNAVANQAPTVDAGANQTITLPNGASLNGSASDDGLPTGSTLVTTWSVVSGPGTVTITNPNNLSTTASFSVAGTYVLRLTAADSALSSNDTVTITVDAAPPVANTILMFVAYNDVWWPEYKVVYEALLSAGYAVEVRSSRAGSARSDYSSDVNQTPSAQGLDPTYPAPVGYTQFTQMYQRSFGQTWNAAWNARVNIPLAGRIQDVTNMNNYVALVMPGGRGQVAYRYDGTYSDLAPINQPGVHVTTAAEVQAAALALNTLIGQALATGKVVAAECHGAPLIPFARVPGSTGGYLNLGRSVLDARNAAGYPFFDGDTPARYANLNVNLVSPERVVVDGPRAPDFNGNARDLIVTSTDWYPETAAYFARTLLNVLTTYPMPAARTRALQVLVFGGDEPTNYPPQAPARYTDLVTLLNDPSDDLAITAVGTSNPGDMTAANLQLYDALVYFRHDTIAQAQQNAIASYADSGGAVIGIHHAIFNHNNQKGTLVQMFGGELPANVLLHSELGVVYTGETNRMINVNYGHFVSTYGVHLLAGQSATTVQYSSSRGVPTENLDNDPTRGYFTFTIPANDELYPGAVFNAGVVFGRGLNQIERLFSNDRFMSGSSNPNNGQYDTSGWVRRYDPSQDGSVGRIVYLQPGETVTRTFLHPSLRQAVKNAVVWAAN